MMAQCNFQGRALTTDYIPIKCEIRDYARVFSRHVCVGRRLIIACGIRYIFAESTKDKIRPCSLSLFFFSC